MSFRFNFGLPKNYESTVKNDNHPIVFIIDKNHSYQEIIKSCLKGINITNIHTFTKSEEVINLKLSPDIIILDYELGHGNTKGSDFFIKYKFTHPDTKFIFFSINTNLELAVSLIRSGAFDYIVKSKEGLDRLAKRIAVLVELQIKQKNSRKAFRNAILSLGMAGIVFIVAIILYNNQII